MNNSIRNILIIIAILCFLIGFAPSYTSLSIDNLAYVVGIGIDVGENNKFKISFQFSPNSLQSTSSSSSESSLNSGSDSESSLSSTINTVEAPSIDSAINIMNSYLAKKINLSHCKVIVFSEEVAYNGISNEIYTLTNNSEVRKKTSLIVSKSTAKSYLENSSPILELLITKYYQIFPYTSNYTGFIYNATLGDFFNNMLSNTSNPYAILGGVNSSDNLIDSLRDSQNIGLAVFKKDKLVGELTANETLAFSILKGNLDSFFLRVEDPDDSNKMIDLIIFPDKRAKITVEIINDTPYITYKNKFIGRIHSIDNDSKYLDEDKLERLSNATNIYLSELITKYLYKTSIEYKTDINGFGDYATSEFLTLKDFEKYDWLDNYSNSIFKVNIDTLIESSILLTET